MVLLSRILSFKSFITTPIFYVNAAPHIGHLYTAVLADAAHRWNHLCHGNDSGNQHGKPPSKCILSTGTDEHGLKIQQAALEKNISPQSLCDEVSKKFKDLFDNASVSYTHFIRTTDNNHKELVQLLWCQLYEGGYIYQSKYEGWYSVPDETFVSDNNIYEGVEQGTKVSKESGHKLEWSSEVNFLFKLSEFQERLLKWITTPPYPIVPDSARRQVLNYILSGLHDISVSRPSSRLYWGIPVPNMSDQTIYVWLDALVNYLTVSNYPNKGHFWPVSDHVIGKDILRFHCIYWPAFLMALNLELPNRIIVHSHWTVHKNKMSKSIGNVVDPFTRLAVYGSDPLRYFLLKESRLHQDGDDRILSLLRGDLADTLGNLLSRVTSPRLYPPSVQVSYHADILKGNCTLIDHLKKLTETVSCHYSNYEFGYGINAVMECLHKTNQFIDTHKPWTLVSDSSTYPHLETVLAIALESIRLSAVLLSPIIPNSSPVILKRLGINSSDLRSHSLYCLLNDNSSVTCTINPLIGEPPLFSKLNVFQ